MKRRFSQTLLLAAIGLSLAQPYSGRGAEVSAAARASIERLLPKEGWQFTVETIPPDDGRDVFEIESRGGKIILRGNNGVAVASALHRYLQDYCHCDLSWNCGDQLHLPTPLPAVAGKVHVTSPYRYRYAYNFCTHGYTMAWWDWPRWQRELDYLALSGVNLALIIEGQESVWIQALKAIGYSEKDVRAWLVLPSHQPWMYMDNLENRDAPVPRDLIQRRLELGRRILARMRELGIEPVLPGYYGMVPPDFKWRFSDARVHAQGNWGKLKRPDILDPSGPMFPKVAKAYYAAEDRLFGGARFYAADPFHEGGSTEGIDIPAASRAILQAMNGANWVLQS